MGIRQHAVMINNPKYEGEEIVNTDLRSAILRANFTHTVWLNTLSFPTTESIDIIHCSAREPKAC